jgi:predicted anti-sigma-YlaC factor YlaD
MITCRQVAELVTDYAEGHLPLLDRLRFQLHLGLCRDCRSYVRQLRVTARALGRLPEPELPPGLRDELLRRFDTWGGRR